MIRFFTNYSYGGYEELYLGKLSDIDEFRYYLPMLPVKEDELQNSPDDEKLKKEVARLRTYPAILRHGTTSEATLPTGSFTLVSKPGFKSMYRRLGHHYLFVVSDIVGGDHDEMGGGQRRNPFTMLFVGEKEDCALLNSLAFEMIENEKQVRKVLGGLFSYDAEANGLRFSLREIIEYLDSIRDRHIEGINLEVDAPLIVLSPWFSLENTLTSQELQGKRIGSVYDAGGKLLRGKPLFLSSREITGPAKNNDEEQQDNPDESGPALTEPEKPSEQETISDWKDKVKSSAKRIKRIYHGMSPEARHLLWGSVLVSFLIGILTISVSKCSHNTKTSKNSTISQTLSK